jgi:ornithine cyclodeaminase/alanine dehydrogenase
MILKRNEISSLLTLEDCTSVVEDAFRMHAEGKTLAPGLLHIDSHDGEFHIKAGGLSFEQTFFALKANGGFFQNMARYGLPNIQGVILLFDGDTGYPLAVMDSMEITIKRTGAATAVAAKHLARPDSTVATICGCGNQGRVQLEALKQALPEIARVFAYDLDEQRAALYASDMSRELAITVKPAANLGEAARQSDVIVTCTPSRQYLLHTDHVSAGTFVAAIGADSPDKQELEPSLLVGNKIVVDILEQCESVGELHHALEAGLLTRQDVHGELGQVVAGQVSGRTSDDEITIFDATGTALQDAAAAVVAYQRAVQESIGLTLDLYE